MNDREDIELLAFEYVLGTLDDAERRATAARRDREPALDAAIGHWEQRLAVLEALGEAVEPPADLFGRIESRLDHPAPAQLTASPGAVDEVTALRRRLARWRASAIAAYAVAASLAVVTIFSEVFFAPPPADSQQFVAVFNEGDEPPQFLLTIDLATRELTIRPVNAEPRAGKTYQLWIASDRIEDSPRSLGLLGQPTGPVRKQLADYDPALLQAATFGISLEPEGGSTTGKPTSPALHGTLHPATQ